MTQEELQKRFYKMVFFINQAHKKAQQAKELNDIDTFSAYKAILNIYSHYATVYAKELQTHKEPITIIDTVGNEKA